MIIIIPSNRKINLAYLQPLIDHGANFIVVYDSFERMKIKHPSFQVYNWHDRKKILGKNDRYFPRGNGSCRNFGFYLAYKNAEENEIIIALDDDCKIESKNFPRQVEQILQPRRRNKILYRNSHFNLLSLYRNIDSNLYPRGFPYQFRSGYDQRYNSETVFCRSDFNLGLWSGVFDVNAVDKINAPKWKYEKVKLKNTSSYIPKNILISVCSMNMQFRKQIIPIVFQFPMNIEIFKDWKINRYGDIWGGFLLKKLMDIKGDFFTAGAPIIRHNNSNGYLQNIKHEHLAHMVNEELIKIISESCRYVKKSSYLNMFIQVFEQMKKTKKLSPILKVYFKELLPAMDVWIETLS